MNYRLVRSRRKTISLSFDEHVRLVVKAPAFLDAKTIDDFVNSNEEWIEKTKNRLLLTKKRVFNENPKLESGDLLPYLGTLRTLTLIEEPRIGIKITESSTKIVMRVPRGTDYEQKRSQLEKWYREAAIELITQKVREYAFRMGVGFNEIKIRDQKTRWGSCSPRGNLNFNWRIIMSPEEVIDYVVIHEVCHLIHMDHSKEFWSLVEKMCPTYKQQKHWLKDNAFALYCI